MNIDTILRNIWAVTSIAMVLVFFAYVVPFAGVAMWVYYLIAFASNASAFAYVRKTKKEEL